MFFVTNLLCLATIGVGNGKVPPFMLPNYTFNLLRIKYMSHSGYMFFIIQYFMKRIIFQNFMNKKIRILLYIESF